MLTLVEPTIHGEITEPYVNQDQLLRPAQLDEIRGEDSIPQVALKRREIEAAQLRPQPCKGTAEIGGMVDKIIDDAAGMAA